MAEATQKKEILVGTEAIPAAKDTAAPQPETDIKEAAAEELTTDEPSATTLAEEAEQKKVGESVSFKEESNVASELPEYQRKALEELKKLVQEALNKHEFTAPPTPLVLASVEEEIVESKVDDSEEVVVVKEEEISVEKTEEKKADVVEEKKAAAVVAVEEKKEEAKPVEVKKEEKKPAVIAAAAGEEEKKEEKKPAATVVAEEKKEEKKEKEGPITVAEVILEQHTTTTTTTTIEATTETVAEEEKEVVVVDTPPPPPEEVSMWGIPLLGDDRSDVILLKFLRARDFKVKETLAMLKKSVQWRKSFGVESLLSEDLGNDYEKVVFTHGSDKQGRPVVYNVFGEFNDKDLYQLAFSSGEKQMRFLRWLVQFVEQTVRRFDFSPEGMNSFVIVNDLKNSPGYGKRELNKIFGKYMTLLQDNYPEFVSKQVCVNVSFWYLAYSWVYVNVLSPRSKSKFIFATASKTSDTLFRYISPEQVPVQYGGHSRTGELEFTPDEPVTEVTVKPSSTHPIEFEFTEDCTFVWELRVVGWEVSYEAQFVPEEGYTVLVTKPKKMSGVSDDPILCESFEVRQPGKLVITIDNHGSKKKKLLYRSKVKTTDTTTAITTRDAEKTTTITSN